MANLAIYRSVSYINGKEIELRFQSPVTDPAHAVDMAAHDDSVPMSAMVMVVAQSSEEGN